MNRLTSRSLPLLLVVVATYGMVGRGPRDAARAATGEQELRVALRGNTIVSPALTAEGNKRILYVPKGTRIKLTVRSEDKTYTFRIEGKAGTEVTVHKNQESSPTHLQFALSGEEHEMQILVNNAQVSTGLYMKAQ